MADNKVEIVLTAQDQTGAAFTSAQSGVARLGDSAGQAAQQFDASTASMIESIKRTTAAAESGGRASSAYFEALAKQRGVSVEALRPYLDGLRQIETAHAAARASLNGIGVSAAQTASAMRSVPAQMTDIVVSLASGQAPMTVLLQQGGQLKDMFGGVGNAAKALGGYVASLVTPVTVAAAAIGGIGYAAYAGSTEMDEFKKNLILTGNISGITADKFNAMAQSMANVSGITRGAAAEALTAMAASGNIGADSIDRLTRSALLFEKAGGPAVADTVKQFEELGKAPVDASVKLNEKTHYLTLAVYEQIKALEEQGKTSEAAVVAQNAWADAIDKRTPQMVQNLGTIQKIWNGFKSGTADVWDLAKSIGRDATTDERIARLQNRIISAGASAANEDLSKVQRDRAKQLKLDLDRELSAITARVNKAEGDARKLAADQAKNAAQIAVAGKYDKLHDDQQGKAERKKKELDQLEADRAADLISLKRYNQAKADIEKKYAEKPAAAPKRTEADKELARIARLDADEAARRIASAQRVGEAMAKETGAIWDRVDAEREAQAAIGLSKSEIEARTQAVMQEQLAWRQALGLEDEQTEQLKRNLVAQKAMVAAVQGTEARQASFDAAKDAAKEAADAHKKAAEEAARAWEKTVDTIDKTFHDAFADMIKSGKADWESFTDSLAATFKTAVADEIYKLTLKPLVVNVVGAFSGAPAVPGADGQALSLSNGFGLLSGAQSAWAGINGGISNAANSFAMSGFGQAAGLSTAGQVMGPPTASGAMGYTTAGATMTSAGSTFAAAAGPVLGALAATYAIAEMQKSGWGSDNNAKNYAKDFALFGGTAGVVVLDRLFGHNRNISNDAQGITGTFDATGFSGQTFQDKSQKGGTFSKDKRWTDYGAIGADMDKALDSMLKQAVAGVQTIGKTLNVETEAAMQGFSHTFALQLSENGDMSKAGEKIAAELKKVQDELTTKLVPNIADFARYGESASDTFARLNNEVQATDAILLAMGKDAPTAFGAVGLASIKAREDLIDLAGGIDSLARKTQTFYSAFYSQDEQLQLAAKQAQTVLASGFSDIGQAIPASREAFRALVESQDLSTESGRKLFNGLLDLSDEFDTVTKASEAAADNLKKSADKLKEATTAAQQGQASLFDVFATDSQKLAAAQKLINDTFAGLGKSVPATAAQFLDLTKAIDPATEAGQSLIATLQKVSGAFSYVEKSAADSAAAKEAAAQAASQAAKEAAQAAAQAATQSSGSRRSIMDQFDPAGALARAQADIAAAFGKYGATDLIPTTRAGVSDVAGRIDTSTALGQQQMSDLSSLSSAFDAVFGAQENAAKAASDAAKAVYDQQAKAAQDALDAAQRAAAEQTRLAQQAADEQMRLANQVHDSISNALRSLLGQSEQFENQSRQMAQATLQSALVIAKAGGSLSNFQGLDAALASVNKLDKATFATAAGYAVEFGRTANLLTQLEQYTRINGSHANGLDYVPFDGYVAQLHKGERVQTAASAAAADATVAEVKALRSDLNAIGAALATYTQKTAKLMEKFDVVGIGARA